VESCTDALETSLEKPGILIDPRASFCTAPAATKSATCSKGAARLPSHREWPVKVEKSRGGSNQSIF